MSRQILVGGAMFVAGLGLFTTALVFGGLFDTGNRGFFFGTAFWPALVFGGCVWSAVGVLTMLRGQHRQRVGPDGPPFWLDRMLGFGGRGPRSDDEA